ncbi:vWA domain-containing protein [Actinoallomurus soli]|uniref:vWA domain-containing protein n=1 Tax=Actinoallomurus soli TaxID=2952535 RepID=UPI002093953A|nr:VWA domain-containing protein [Actinoallomurus soli]MCO5969692.1 VWA domain-containing protein [Actinoallomurus soli]
MALLDRHLGFVAALREAGLPVSLAEGLDAVHALAAIDLAERESLRAAYAATLVKRQASREAFDTLFDLWFPPVTGSPEEARERPAYGDPEVRRLRDELSRLLLDGDDDLLRAFARQAVGTYGRGSGGGAGESRWFSYQVLRTLSPETLMAGLLTAVLTERGGLDEKVARRTFTRRVERFERLVAEDVRRRIAEDGGAEKAARGAVRRPLDEVDFLRATRADLAAIRREIHPLARRLAARLAHRRRHGRRGRLDFRRTVRASLSTGGVPLTTHHRPPRPHKPELVVLCDASDSVSSFAHFTLLLTYALREQFARVRAFAFIDDLDEITRFFAPGADVVEAMTRMTREARLVWISGHSDYGRAFGVFEDRYADAVTPKTSLLILGDARSNYGSLNLETVERLAGRARHAYWLNPEPVRDWDTGDSAASAYGAVVPMRECRNLTQLADFVESLA